MRVVRWEGEGTGGAVKGLALPGSGSTLRRMSGATRGIWLAVGAYLLWGLLPVYWKLLHTVPASRILAHRIVWSFLFLLALLSLRGEGAALRRMINRRVLAVYGLAGALLSVNWLTFLWAVNADRLVEASLGYYINPLVSVVLAVGFLRERLRPVQWLAVGVAAGGVAYLTWRHGSLPWVALVLAFSFGFYGLVKKQAPLPALAGLAVETGMLWAPAAVLLLVAAARAGGEGPADDRVTVCLLVLGGVVTGLPLLLFAAATRCVNLSTIGVLQYVAPSCQLLIAVGVYHEPFGAAQGAGFVLIWAALAIYTLDHFLRQRA